MLTMIQVREVSRRRGGHGGRRKGAGRPRTNGSAAVPTVSFRLGAEDYDLVRRTARATGIGVNALAKRALLDSLKALRDRLDLLSVRNG